MNSNETIPCTECGEQTIAALATHKDDTDWKRIALVQNAKLMAMTDGEAGFAKLCEVLDRYKTAPVQAELPPLPRAALLVGPDLESLSLRFTKEQMFSYARAALATQEPAVQPELLLDGMSVHQYMGLQLYEFQEATGYDTAEEYKASKSTPQPAAGVTLSDAEIEAAVYKIDDLIMGHGIAISQIPKAVAIIRAIIASQQKGES